MKWLLVISLALLLGDDPPKDTISELDSIGKKFIAQQEATQNDMDTIKLDLKDLIRRIDSLNKK